MDKKSTVNWEAIINDYKVSSKSQRQFCKDNNLVLSTFCKRLNSEKSTTKRLNDGKSVTKSLDGKKLAPKKPFWIGADVCSAKPQIEINVGKFRISVTEFNDTLLNVIQALDKLC